MTVLDGAFWVSCLVLVAAGATKTVDPDPLAHALRSLWGARPGGPARNVARTLGLTEVLVGTLGLAVGGPVLAAAAASLYVVFAAVVLVARRRGLRSCGCFGERSGPPTLTHAGLNLVSAAVCSLAVAWPVQPVGDVVAAAGTAAVLGLLAVLAATALVVMLEAR